MYRILFFIIFLSFSINSFANYNRGLKAFTYKNYEKAKEAFSDAVENNPKNGNAYYFLGEIEKLNNNFDEAFKYYTLALENPINKKYRKLAFWNLIVILETKNDIENVVKTCKIFWEKTHDDSAKEKVEKIINKILWSNNDAAKNEYARAIELKNSNKIEEAKGKFFKALELDSSFLAPKFEIGFILYNNNNISESISYFETIAQKIPFHSSVNLLLADIYFKNKSYQQAINYYNNVINYGFNSRNTRYTLFLKRGTCFYNLQNYEMAEADINQCLDISSKNTKPLYLMSAIYIKLNNYEKALNILNRLNAISPNNTEVIYQLGSIHYKLEDQNFAKYFDKLFNLSLGHMDTIPGKYFKAFKILGEYHYSIRSYYRASLILDNIPFESKDKELNYKTAHSFYEARKYPKTIEILEKLSLSNDESILLIKAYLKEGFSAKAKTLLQNIIQYDSQVREKALNDKDLSKLTKYIIDEMKLKEEEERKRIEEMKQKEEDERKKLEEIRLKEEEENSKKNNLNNQENNLNNNDTSLDNSSNNENLNEEAKTLDN